MTANDYAFLTRWRVEATPEEVVAVLSDPADLPRWWPSVYLEVKVLRPGGAHGVGQDIELFTKGFLPYTLRWRMRVAEVEPLRRIRVEARGDFVGHGEWKFAPDGAFTDVSYEWVVRADKPLLQRWSFLIRPFFAANHHWAMRKGEESLKLELLRRRAKTPEERARIPAPPQPTFRRKG